MQTTSATWRGLFAAGAAVEARATIGGTVYTDISAPVIHRATMQDSLSVGNVVSASLSLALREAGSVPRSAAVAVEARLNDGVTASEWLPQGTFYISRRARDPVTGTLALACYDALLKANALWTPSAGEWPRTMAAVTAELAALLGVTVDSRTVIPTGAAYVISEPAAGTTIRDALSTIAQAAGGNWIMTPSGLLRLVRLGEAGVTVDVAGVVGGIEVAPTGAVTGVRDSWEEDVYLTGDDTGIVVDVSLPPAVAADMAVALIGLSYQPYSLAGAIYDPAAELGDSVRAGAGGEVSSVLCSEQVTLGPAFRGDIAAPAPGEVTDEYPYIGGAEKTLALARAAVADAVEQLDDTLTPQEIFNRLTDNGNIQGLFMKDGQIYFNASYIQSGTLILGGLDNQNGTMLVLDANGNVAATITNLGMELNNGSVASYSADKLTRTMLANGIFAVQQYFNLPTVKGWQDVLAMYRDSDGTHVSSPRNGTFFIQGGGRVNLTNKDASGGTPDLEYAIIDMDDDSVTIRVIPNSGTVNTALIQFTPDLLKFMFGTRYEFDLSPGTSPHPLSIGNGGTGANNAAGARTNLGAVNKAGDTMTGTLRVDCSSDSEEADIVAISLAGSIYLYSGSSNTGNRGLFTRNAAGTGKGIILINQNNDATFNGNATTATSATNVTGTVAVDHGGTGATTPANACANLAPGIPTAEYTLVPNSNYGPNVSGGVEPLRCVKYGNGLKRLVGLISITGNGAQSGGVLCTVPTGFEHINNNNGGLQGWGSITKSSGGESYLFRFSGNTVSFWGANVPTGTYAVNYLYF